MLRISVAALVIVVSSLALAATASSRATSKTLKGTVGPGFTITLKHNGKKVKTLRHGTYTFSISDKSVIHNFTLEKEKGSSKFEKTLTGTSFTGKKTMKVKLTKGKFKYYCSIHQMQMFGFFRVT